MKTLKLLGAASPKTIQAFTPSTLHPTCWSVSSSTTLTTFSFQANLQKDIADICLRFYCNSHVSVGSNLHTVNSAEWPRFVPYIHWYNGRIPSDISHVHFYILVSFTAHV